MACEQGKESMEKMKGNTMNVMRLWLLLLLAGTALVAEAAERRKMNFNEGWRLFVGDVQEARQPDFEDGAWQQVTLPYAFNGDEAFR